MSKEIQPTIADLTGSWRRSLFAEPDGRRDTTTQVQWFQGPSIYIDLRQPVGRPDFRNTIGLEQLTSSQIDWLVGQAGFAGELHYEDGYFEWQREVDFQLTAPWPDQGSICFVGDVMVEEGKNSPYLEHWHRESDGANPVCAMRLDDPSSGCRGFLVRLGNRFMYARGRAAAYPSGVSLADCVAQAPNLTAAQSLVDCEISQGAITFAGWTIQRSTLPFREGCTLAPRLSPSRSASLAVADVNRHGEPMERRWIIVDAQGDLRDFSVTLSGSVTPLRKEPRS